jgi:hypothetical protein
MREEPAGCRDFLADKAKSGQVSHQPGHPGGPGFLSHVNAGHRAADSGQSC